MEALRDVSLVAALVTTGLMSGVYLAFSISVLPGLARTDDDTFVRGMRGMNAAILNPFFAAVFGGPLLLDLVALLTRLGPGERVASLWIAVALGLYVVTFGVTAVVNVPLNNRLDTTEPAAQARSLFEATWVRWNVVRTVVATLSFVALVLAVGVS